MKDKGHFYTSIAKSIVRITGCFVTLYAKDIAPMAVAFLFAEILGIVEEVLDDR